MKDSTRVLKIALPETWEGTNRKGVLIIHGFTGYPGELKELAGIVHAQGYTVSLPRLPGHGTNRNNFLKTNGRDWFNHVANAYLDLQTRCDTVSVMGLSLGGVLTLLLAEKFAPEKIALMAPAMAVSDPLFSLTPFLRFFIPRMKKTWETDGDEDEEKKVLGREYWSYHFPGQLAQVHKLIRRARKNLDQVTCPALILLSEADSTVPLKAGEIIENGIPHDKVRKVVLKTSPHVIVAGDEKDIVFREIVQWLNSSL